MDKIAYALAAMLVFSVVPLGAPQELQTAPVTASIQTAISISIKGAINWGTITKAANNVLPPAPWDSYYVRIENTTNVRVDIWAKIDNSTYGMAGIVTAYTAGGDNQIENIGWWSGPNATGTWALLGSTSLVPVPWMQNQGPPGGAAIELYAYPALSTSETQVAGTYGGTLTVQAAEG
jgi:spore coat protein U-like protein